MRVNTSPNSVRPPAGERGGVARAQKCKLILSPPPPALCLGFPLYPWVNAGAVTAAPSTWMVVCVVGPMGPRRR